MKEAFPEFAKAAAELFGNFKEFMLSRGKASASSSLDSSSDASQVEADGRPKSLFIDPFALVDTMGVGYRVAPQSLTYDMLRAIAEKDTIIAAIHARRLNQVATFCQLQPNKYSVGFDVHLRGRKRGGRMTQSERDKADYITHYLQNTGREDNLERDNLTNFCKKFVRDSLTYDAATFEKQKTLGGDPLAFLAVDAGSIRFRDPVNSKGTPTTPDEQQERPEYLQYVAGQIHTWYKADEMAYCIRNPRTSVRVWRYGFPELEVLINTVTGHLQAEQWNRNIFVNGSTTPGFLNVKGKVDKTKMEALERAWRAQVTGAQNAHRFPIINSDDLSFVPINWNNDEMGFQAWLEYLIKCACAVYCIDPAEIMFDLRGGIGQQPMYMSSNEAQQKTSRDQGLRPLLNFTSECLNRHVVWQIDPRFEVSFVGLDAKTEEQNYELRSQQSATTHTLNEVRALEGLAPVPYGNLVMNPVYVSYVQGKEAEAAGGVQGGAPAPGGGEGEEPPPTEEDRAFLSKPGEEEREAAGRLMQFGDKQQPQQKGKDDSIDVASLFQNDWTSDVRASQPAPDLRKSAVPAYETIPLD